MATVWWHPCDTSKDSVHKRMDVPKRASDINHWVKSARKAIPDIPSFETGTLRCTVEVDPDFIKVSWKDIGWMYIDRTTRKAI